MPTNLKAFFANLIERLRSRAHIARNPGDQPSFGGHLSTELRLGPHSTEAVFHSHSFGASAFIVSMQQEMYKDALHFLREARANHAKKEADPFITWRNLRATILFSFAAIESCINQFIDEHIERSKLTLPRKDIDKWAERSGFVSIGKKLNEGVMLFGGERLDADANLWANYMELKDLRDALVHYRGANRLFYNADELLSRAAKGMGTTSSVIKKIYLSHPANSAYPNAFDEVP